jgi:site-specific DNA recombinase
MKAAIYGRVSSEKQDVDLSISAQLKALREYASRNGYQIVREFVDEAESGRTSARPAFREMIAMARRSPKPFDVILVWKYSRFARSRQDSIVFKTMLRKNGVQVISITEPFEDSPTGRLLEAMIESIDEFYSANLSEEITRGMRESASRGFYVVGFTPYGYDRIKMRDGSKERSKLEPNPHQAPIVARMFKEVLEGKGLKEVVKGLNRDGIASPRGKGWIKTAVHRILTNEVYTGTLLWGKCSAGALAPIRVENAWPTIVSRDIFDQVQALLKARAPSYLHPKRTASHFLLSGIARCGYCGKALVGHDAKSGQFSYYVCGTLLKKGAGACQARYINSREFEGLVVDKIKEHILTEENLRELVRLVNEEMDTASREYHRELDVVIKEIADVNRRLDRLYDSVETANLKLDDLAPRIKDLKARKDNLQARKWELEWQMKERKLELADTATVTHYVQDLRDVLSNSSLAERKSFIKSFVKEIRVTGDKALLNYAIPLPPRGLTVEEMPVLSNVHFGSAYRIRTGDLLLEREVS